MSEPTFEHKLRFLFSYDFSVGLRHPRVNPAFSGAYMVVEGLEEYLNDAETWALVGDDLPAMVNEAWDFGMGMFDNADKAMADILAGGTGLCITSGADSPNES